MLWEAIVLALGFCSISDVSLRQSDQNNWIIDLDLHRMSVCNVLSLYCKNGVVGDKSLIHGAY